MYLPQTLRLGEVACERLAADPTVVERVFYAFRFYDCDVALKRQKTWSVLVSSSDANLAQVSPSRRIEKTGDMETT